MSSIAPIAINGRKVGAGSPPYVVAELSGNHGGSLQQAMNIIKAAADCGCEAVKLQTYRADTITIDHDGPGFVLEDGLWAGQTLYELYETAQTPWEWLPDLFALGKELNVTVFSSPFDETAVDFLEELDAPAYKISSFELVDIPLIERCARTGKPLIMSTGMASLDEISEAVECAKDNGSSELILLHCVSGYPTPAKDMNLVTLKDMAERFKLNVGLSDHTLDSSVSVAAVALGAVMIEKHFCISREDGGSDVEFSIEPPELSRLLLDTKTAWEALGSTKYGTTDSDAENVIYRRSLYVTQHISAGEELSSENTRSIRPGHGLAPKHLKEVMGRRAKHDLPKGTPLSWDDLS